MKLTILLFFTLFTSPFNQTKNENFLIENNEVLWQKTYPTELSKEQLFDKIQIKGKFANIFIFQDKLTATIPELVIDYIGSGESALSTPSYLSSSFIKAFVVFEFKDKRYRVTIKNIKFIQKFDTSLSKLGQITEIEEYALSKKNTEFKNNFFNKPSKILKYTFSKLTEMNKEDQSNIW